MIDPIKLSLKSIKRPLLAARARRARQRRNGTVIAVTGSSGKTTTTELIARILNEQEKAIAFSGHNTLKAIQKNLLLAHADIPFMVQEVSAGRPGAAAEAAALLRHDVAVVTVVAAEHLKQFRSVDAIADAKGDLVAALPADGFAVLNADDPRVAAMRRLTSARIVTFGFAEDADLRCLAIRNRFPDGLGMTVRYHGCEFSVQSQLVGRQWTAVLLASILTALELGATRSQCIRAIASFRPRSGRCSVHMLPSGPMVLNDAYKAPAWSIDNFLMTVAEVAAPRKTVVFGIVSDNPRDQGVLYRGLARKALAVAHTVIFVGAPVRFVEKMRTAEIADRLLLFPTTRDARQYLGQSCRPGEVIFLKGNQSSHLDRIIFDWERPISCWQESCGRKIGCLECRQLREKTRRSGMEWLTTGLRPHLQTRWSLKQFWVK